MLLHAHERDITDTQALQNPTLRENPLSSSEHQHDTFAHWQHTCVHEKCVLCVSHIPEDLATVMRAWDRLPAAVKAGIVAIVQASRSP
jgi:hypothetical protein